MTVEVVGLDGDDTLWRNEEYFSASQQAFRDLLAPSVTGEVDVAERLEAKERANLELFGYVSYVVTDLAVLRWDKDRFVVDAVAPGFTPQEVIALTEMDIGAAPNVRTME